jgi:hypothetical protein
VTINAGIHWRPGRAAVDRAVHQAAVTRDTPYAGASMELMLNAMATDCFGELR